MSIPDKLTYKRKEVIQLTKLDGRVLDYWENEFSAFKPVVNQSGEKFYSRSDLEAILQIKHFLMVEKLDKEQVKKMVGPAAAPPVASPSESSPGDSQREHGLWSRLRGELEAILTILDKNDKK